MTTAVSARLRAVVRKRAGGLCEYCRVPETVVLVAHQVDHVRPLKHGGATVAANLALACTLCNRRKGSDLAGVDPQTDTIVALFDPRTDRWGHHFDLHDAELVGLTPTGRATVGLLQLNRPERLAERQILLAAGMYNVG